MTYELIMLITELLMEVSVKKFIQLAQLPYSMTREAVTDEATPSPRV
jgi:hypothetical protein